MASKKGTSKKTPKKKAGAKKAEPEVLERDDMLTLQIAATSRENAVLKVQLTQSNLEKLTEESKVADAQLTRLSQQANEKYKLTPGKDKIDLGTGAIIRG